MKVAIVSTHPIQYNAPWFKLLSQQEGVSLKVFYTWGQSQENAKYDPGFGRVVEWDIPLLEGYDFCFVNNIAKKPGSNHFRGIDNPSLNTEIESWGADALLISGWAFKSHLKCIKYFKGKIPVLFRGDSTLLNEQGGLKQLARRIFLKYVYSYIDYALYVGENNKKYFLAHGVKENQLVFAPHAVDNSRFMSNSAEHIAEAKKWKAELGILESDPVILYAGKLYDIKNPLYIIELSKKLQREDLKFVVVGNGDLEDELKLQAKGDERFVFVDFQNQSRMPVVYRLCDFYVMPSLSETWGLAINEAIACGKVVIATDKTGCAPDMIRDGVNGVVVSINDTTKAADFIEEYLKGQEKRKLAQEANTEILKIYSYERMVSGIYNLLKRVC